MSREIKFRGRPLDRRGWVYGYYFVVAGHHFILPPGRSCLRVEVIPETVGQYTGRKADGVEIYDGDIVKLCYGIPPTYDTLIIEYADDEEIADSSVSGWWMRNIRKNGVSGSLCKTYENDLEVIRNIHQNPELLEKPNESD